MEIYTQLVNEEIQTRRNRILRQISFHESELAIGQNKKYEENMINMLKDQLIVNEDPKNDTSETALEDRILIIEHWMQYDFETIKRNYLKNIRSVFSVADNVRYVCRNLNIECPPWFITKYNL